MDCIFFNSFDGVIFFTKEIFLRMKIKNKKADVTTGQLVIIIILIMSFIVIVFFLVRLGLGRESDKQICHESVVLKSTTKGFVGYLDCKTNYLCISGGGKCEGINPTTTVKVNPNNKEEIMKAIADEMADCWWMFGEGKLNYLGIGEKGVWGKNSCAICSIVRFDEKILSKGYKISYREALEYLENINKGDMTYFTYLYDSANVDEFIRRGGTFNIDLDNNYILDDDEYVIVTGIKSSAMWGLAKKDVFIFPSYLKSNQISKLECDEFITKA